MENDRIAKALDMIEKLKAEEKISQAEACRRIGVSDSIVCSLRKGNYKGRVSDMLDIIEGYFNIKDEQKQAYREPEYVETSISSKVYSVIKVCRIKGGYNRYTRL